MPQPGRRPRMAPKPHHSVRPLDVSRSIEACRETAAPGSGFITICQRSTARSAPRAGSAAATRPPRPDDPARKPHHSGSGLGDVSRSMSELSPTNLRLKPPEPLFARCHFLITRPACATGSGQYASYLHALGVPAVEIAERVRILPRRQQQRRVTRSLRAGPAGSVGNESSTRQRYTTPDQRYKSGCQRADGRVRSCNGSLIWCRPISVARSGLRRRPACPFPKARRDA